MEGSALFEGLHGLQSRTIDRTFRSSQGVLRCCPKALWLHTRRTCQRIISYHKGSRFGSVVTTSPVTWLYQCGRKLSPRPKAWCKLCNLGSKLSHIFYRPGGHWLYLISKREIKVWQSWNLKGCVFTKTVFSNLVFRQLYKVVEIHIYFYQMGGSIQARCQGITSVMTSELLQQSSRFCCSKAHLGP